MPDILSRLCGIDIVDLLLLQMCIDLMHKS